MDRMSPEPSSVKPDHTLAAANALMHAEGIRHVPVIEDSKLVGILSDRDLRNHWGYLDRTKVNAAMTPDPITVGPEVSIEQAVRLLLSHKVGSLPVVKKGVVIGIITTTDLLRALLDVGQGASAGCRHLGRFNLGGP
jgi:acetoin utilization protein AcuB